MRRGRFAVPEKQLRLAAICCAMVELALFIVPSLFVASALCGLTYVIQTWPLEQKNRRG